MQEAHRRDMQAADCSVARIRSLCSLLDRGRAGSMVGEAWPGADDAEVAGSVRCDSPSTCGMREEAAPSADVDEHASSLRGSRAVWQRRSRR